ncbi:MAG TPA: hypothetical protein ENG95_06135 [Nitrospirae bacterium]|nr:hypothetical protein BMS3Abin10_02544 [bacterium BMS3Abin10]GBE38282.1 hypothetical protein BMS3Bbin08_00885 [bacterium BMS3Bbin08]HDH51351.1 hypothetical protein [Nitrospirota bacterium]HDK16931.1 hypothetical protein [Nitrospirota bacterium]HDK82542.1 hypothetical protein [Nitrospirota bacterium]
MIFLFIRRRNTVHVFIAVIACLLFFGCAVLPSVQTVKPAPAEPQKPLTPRKSFKPEEYSPSSGCAQCHDNIFEQHSQSMHAKSFENPVFQAQYFKELLPKSITDADLFEETRACIACHAPIAYLTTARHILSKEQIDKRTSGVTCDFCHTIGGYEGKSPGDANYISMPGDEKLGPFKKASTWHHVYSELQTKSEFCAICHNRTNHHGLEIGSTFTEWKNSRFAEEGIQCQDCHMNVQGFLVAGKPVYEAGKAADMRLGDPPFRTKLYTHRFPGAHSKTQVVGALTMNIEVEEAAALPGDDITIHVRVNNSKTGHKMSSGSAELRMLYIDLNAYSGDKVVSIPTSPGTTNAYDVTGKGEFDKEILGDAIPEGKRIYRTIFIDEKGKQTLFSYDAVKIIFDNRLKAGEIREEIYRFKVPEEAEGAMSLVTNLYYLRYPSAFAKRLSLPEADIVEIASATKTVIIKDIPDE